MIKIISKKEYNRLIEENKQLKEENEQLFNKVINLEKFVERNKTSCNANNGKEFCFNCKHSYKYKTMGWNGYEIEKPACLLTVSCENFEEKDKKIANEYR